MLLRRLCRLLYNLLFMLLYMLLYILLYPLLYTLLYRATMLKVQLFTTVNCCCQEGPSPCHADCPTPSVIQLNYAKQKIKFYPFEADATDVVSNAYLICLASVAIYSPTLSLVLNGLALWSIFSIRVNKSFTLAWRKSVEREEQRGRGRKWIVYTHETC